MDHDELLWRAEAVERVLALRADVLADHGTETVPLDAVAGRTLATDIVAEADAPPRSFATMDGFALRADEDHPLKVQEGEVFPEDDPEPLPTGATTRIATGAPLPDGADVVLNREAATVTDGELEGPALEAGTYVYEQGRNYRAGETLFAAGERLGARDAILLGDMGHETVPVHEPLSAGVVATGTEIHEGTTRDLDSPMLAGLVRSWGHEATYEGSAPDEYERVRNLLATTARDHDVVVSTGGTSVGHKDHVVRALADLGEVRFHKVRVRPGKPIAVARLPDQDAVAFAVPGKPVGAHVVAALTMGPFFTGEGGPYPSVEATLSAAVELGTEGFEYVVPVTLADGTATPLGHASSPLSVYEERFDPSVLSSSTRATRADGVVITTEPLAAGATVDVVPWSVLE